MTTTATSAVLPNGYLDLVQSGLAANLPAAASFLVPPNHVAFYYATDTGTLYRYNTSTNAWDSGTNLPITVGASASALAVSGKTYLLNTAAGSVLTLPPATGSGATVTAIVTTTTTSAAHKILTNPVTDKLMGTALGATVSTKAALLFSAGVASAFHSLQMPFSGSQPSGGFEGDSFVLRDIAAGVWAVDSIYQSGTTPTTPFSTATT